MIIIARMHFLPSHHALPLAARNTNLNTRHAGCHARLATRHNIPARLATALRRRNRLPRQSHHTLNKNRSTVQSSGVTHSHSQLVAWHCETASPTLAGSPRENANPNNPSPQSLGTCLWHSACLSLTFSSAPNQPDPLACRKPKKSVSRAAPSDLSSHNPSWLHEIALMHTSKSDPQPRWRWVQCWGLAYALWPDVAHTISTYTLLLYSQGSAFQGFVKQRLLILCMCASQWRTPKCSILPAS
jgi:hypothetical protein